MTWRERLARFSPRERQLIGVAGAVLGFFLLYMLVISPFLSYREELLDNITAHRSKLENAQAYMARTADIARQREQLDKAYQQVHSQLVPGDTPTLAAANLQSTLGSLAGEKGVEIQSTQVMRDDTVGAFRRIAVRITVTGDLKQLADFLAGLEHGQTRVTIPFLELSRRGAALRGKTARALSATIETTAMLQSLPPAAAAPAAAAPGAGPAVEGAEAAPPDAPNPTPTVAAGTV